MEEALLLLAGGAVVEERGGDDVSPPLHAQPGHAGVVQLRPWSKHVSTKDKLPQISKKMAKEAAEAKHEISIEHHVDRAKKAAKRAVKMHALMEARTAKKAKKEHLHEDTRGLMPLRDALQGHQDVVRVLVEHRANVLSETIDGSIDISAQNLFPDRTPELCADKMLKAEAVTRANFVAFATLRTPADSARTCRIWGWGGWAS